MKIGIVGCGNIVGQYIEHSRQFKDIIEIAAVSDMDIEKAQAAADKIGSGVVVCSVDEMMAMDEIEIVVNLTPPLAHAEVAMKALAAGKNIHNEKPLAIFRDDAKKMLALAESKGLRIGCAPDTFLGAGIQTSLKLLNEGAIGEPIGAFAQMMGRGPEGWHPNPDFFYKVGAGPMFDIGPYILTALVVMLGPVKRVTGSARISFPERTIGSKARYGEKIKVEVPTHIVGVLDFEQGSIGNVNASFDCWKNELPRIEIYGSEGTLSVPDPNQFGGPVKLWKPGMDEWEVVPLLETRQPTGRIIGVADMASAIKEGRPHRANGQLAYHVLDLMHTIHDASRDNEHKMMESTCERPAPLYEELG